MIEAWAAWFRARTGRERFLLIAAGVFVFGVVAPFLLIQSVSQFRSEAGRSLADANTLAADVRALAARTQSSGPALPAHDGSLRGLAFAAAAAHGLTIAQTDEASAGRLRVVFGASQSTAIYRWFDTMTRHGAIVSRTTLVRAGEGDLVTGEFELSRTP